MIYLKMGGCRVIFPHGKERITSYSESRGFTIWFKSCPSLLSAPRGCVMEALGREHAAPWAGDQNSASSIDAAGTFLDLWHLHSGLEFHRMLPGWTRASQLELRPKSFAGTLQQRLEKDTGLVFSVAAKS